MRLVLVSAFTFALYAGPALAQDANQAAPATGTANADTANVDYARTPSRDARHFARNAQRMAREQAVQTEEAATSQAPLPVDETVIVTDETSDPDQS